MIWLHISLRLEARRIHNENNLVGFCCRIPGRASSSDVGNLNEGAPVSQFLALLWKNYFGWRYSPLTQITTSNVAQLAPPAWILPTVPGNNRLHRW